MGKLFMELGKIVTIIVYSVSIAIILGMFIKLVQIAHTWYWMY